MHKVEFWFAGVAGDGGGLFRRVLLMPFTPAAGIHVSFGVGGRPWRIARALWVAAEHKFICRLDDAIHPGAEWQAMKARCLAQGWRLEKEVGPAERPQRRRLPRWLAECRGEG
jgi:hypothetical protein